MARTTYVKKAQQRYATVPVLNEDGTQKTVPVLSKRTGEQKVTKSGRAVVKRLTQKDLSKPLPMPECDNPKCKHEDRSIKVSEPYKHITPKSGPYGGRTRYRHGDCPTWHVWEYSSSLSARLQQIQYDYDQAISTAETPEDVEAALSAAADEANALAEEKRDGAENIRSGFGHDTYQSEELDQTADDLEQWASEIEDALGNIPAMEDYPCGECQGEGTKDCLMCSGSGRNFEEDKECEECDSGIVDCDDCGADHSDPDAWREAIEEITVVEDCPL